MVARAIVEAFERVELCGGGQTLADYCANKPMVAEQYFRLLSGLLRRKANEPIYVVTDEEDLAFLHEIEGLGIPEGKLSPLFDLDPSLAQSLSGMSSTGLLRRIQSRKIASGPGAATQAAHSSTGAHSPFEV